MARYVVQVKGNPALRAVREPYAVVDMATNQIIDAYASQRAAKMHADELNDAARAADVGR